MIVPGETVAQQARAFRVWREATSVRWDCSAEELADAVQLTVSQVRQVCRSHCWLLLADEQSYSLEG